MRPTKGNGLTAGNSQPAKTHTKHTTILEAPPTIVNVVDLATERQAKDAATLIARFAIAMAGHAVHPGDAGDFLVCRYGLSRWCENLAALQAFAVRVGVSRE